ncbi:MAG: thioredoxin family protein [Bacteroidota bacterium]
MLNIKIIGKGCPNCKKLESLCNEVVKEENIEAQIDKVTEVNEFADYGVTMTPGLVVNGKLLSQGKIPVKHTLSKWLNDQMKN